jgi:hypothetical protein
MIKVKVIKPFYYAKDKILYVDEERYKELNQLGYVEKVKEETIKIEKATHDKTRILSNKSMEDN